MPAAKPLARFSRAMVAAIVLAGVCYIVWTAATYQAFVGEKALAEARTLSAEASSAWDYINDVQPRINYNSDGTYDFKGVYCTIAGKSIARKLAEGVGGSLCLEAPDGPGCTFALRIPVRFEEAGHEDPAGR